MEEIILLLIVVPLVIGGIIILISVGIILGAVLGAGKALYNYGLAFANNVKPDRRPSP